jgi:hypothetical protein
MTLSARIRRALFFPVGVLLLGGFLPGASTPVQGQERNVPSQRPSAGLRIGFVSVGNLVPLPPDLQPERTIRWIMHQVYGPGLIEPPGREEDAPVYLLASEFGPRPVRGTWRIRLRPGVVFHDGSELDPEDVRETLLLYKRLAEAGHPDIDPVFRLIDSVEVRADGAVDFTLGRHLQDQPWRIGRVVPLPAGRARLVRGDLSEMQGQLIAQFVDRPPVGLGGYLYEPVDPRTSDPGEALFVLRAFDRYFQGRPVFREAMIRFYPNDRQLMQAVVTGELDVVGILPRLASEELTSLLANRVEVQYRRFPQTEHFYYLAVRGAGSPAGRPAGRGPQPAAAGLSRHPLAHQRHPGSAGAQLGGAGTGPAAGRDESAPGSRVPGGQRPADRTGRSTGPAPPALSRPLQDL